MRKLFILLFTKKTIVEDYDQKTIQTKPWRRRLLPGEYMGGGYHYID